MSQVLLSRRAFLRSSGLGTLVLLGANLPGLNAPAAHAAVQFPAATNAALRPMGETFMPDAEVSITAVEKTVQILPGAQTRSGATRASC